MKKNVILLLVCATFIFSSCTYHIFDFTIISTKNIDLSKGATFERDKQRIEGVDMVHWIIIIPNGDPHIQEAIDRAIESIPGCVALLDGVVSGKWWYIPYIYGQQSFIVEGTPLIDPSLVFNPDDIPTYGKIEVEKNGEIKSIKNITSTEYLALKNKIVKDSKMIKYKNSIEIE